MSGKRQHFIPQFLQRGFASHFVGNEAFTWVFRKGLNPFPANIKNVGVEGYFYSLDSDPELDNLITNWERDLSVIISDLRSQDLTVLNNPEVIAKLLAHLEVRTRHLRQVFLETGSNLMDELLKHLSNREVFMSYFQKEIQRNPYLIENAMQKEMQKLGIPEHLFPVIFETSKPQMRQVFEDLIAKIPEVVAAYRGNAFKKIAEGVKSGHIQALIKTLAPENKVNRFVTLRYSIKSTFEVLIPLGDSIVLFHVLGSKQLKPFLDKKDELIAVFLPLSPNHVLVGSNINYIIDFSRLQREIVRCSREHFISTDSDAELEKLSPLIGENAYLLSHEEIEKIASDIFND